MEMLIILLLIAAVFVIAAAGPMLAERDMRNARRVRDGEMEIARIRATGAMLEAHNRRMASLYRQQIPGGIHADHCARCGRTLMLSHDLDKDPYCVECDADQTDF